jgi:osmotically inducible lipoprotein OsmB
VPFPIVGTSAIFEGGLYTAAWILWCVAFSFADRRGQLQPRTALRNRQTHGPSLIRPLARAFTRFHSCRIIGSAFWVLGAFLYLLWALGHAAAVTISNVRPGAAKWVVIGAVAQFIGFILVFIGACVFSGGDLDTVSAGAILFMIGFSLYTLHVLIMLGVAWTNATLAAIFTDPRQRNYAWVHKTSHVPLLIQSLFYLIGSITLVVRDPQGLWLGGGILFIVASVYGFWGWLGQMRAGYTFYAPTLMYMTPAYMGQGFMPGAATGAAVGGATGMAAAKGMGGGAATGAGTGAATGAATSAAMPPKSGSTGPSAMEPRGVDVVV